MTAEELLPVFREQFPEFNAKSDATVLLYLNNALRIHAICGMATVYLAAHLCVIDAESGVGGSGGSVDGGGARETVSETAKSVSASFAKLAKDGTDDAFYTTTPYGRMYIVLRNSCPGKKFSVRVA